MARLMLEHMEEKSVLTIHNQRIERRCEFCYYKNVFKFVLLYGRIEIKMITEIFFPRINAALECFKNT